MLFGMGGVLDPQGPIGAAERLILFERHGDHAGRHRAGDRADARLRLVVPRRQHPGALPARLGVFRPGRAGRLVDPGAGRDVPGRHRLDRLARPRSAASRSPRPQPSRSRSRSCRSTGSGCSSTPSRASPASTASSCRPARRCTSASPRPGVMNSFFVPQLGSQIYAMAGMATRLLPAGRQARHLSRPQRAVQRRRLLRHALRRSWRCAGRQFDDWVASTQGARRAARRASYAELGAARHASTSRSTFGTVAPRPVRDRAIRQRGDSDARQAHLGRDPVRPAHPAGGLARGDPRRAGRSSRWSPCGRAGGPICGANGSPASTTSGSA